VNFIQALDAKQARENDAIHSFAPGGVTFAGDRWE